MKRPAIASAVLLFLTVSISGQTFSFGEPFPLTNTRYGPTSAEPLLRSNGEDLYAFWNSQTAIRMTRVVDGARRGGVPVLTSASQDVTFGEFDAVWNGTHFVVAGSRGSWTPHAIETRLVASHGEPLAPPVIAADGASVPHLAFNGRTILLLYRAYRGDAIPEIRALPLSPDGRPTGTASAFVAIGQLEALASNGDGFVALVRRGQLGNTLAIFDANGQLQRTTPFPALESASALAANGSGYVAVLTGLAEVQAIPIDAFGDAGAPLRLDSRPPSIYRWGYINPSATWTGSEWAIAYTISDHQAPWQLVAVTVDPDVAMVTSRDVMEGARSAGIAATAAGTFVAKLSPSGYPSIPEVAVLPFTGARARDFIFKAADQRLVTSASTGDAILVVWREWMNNEWSLRGGIRTQSGEWVEGSLAEGTGGAVAATSGEDFTVFIRRANGAVALRLDRQLRIISKLEVPFMPEAVASNGEVYALVGFGRAVVWTPSGVAGTPISAPYFEPVIASDGEGFLIAGIKEPMCEFMLCIGGDGIVAARYDANLRLLDAQAMTIPTAWQLGPAVAWNGRDYILTWTERSRGQFAATVPRNGGGISSRGLTTHDGVTEPQIVAVRGGVIITGRDADIESTYVDRFLYLDANGTVTEREPFVHSGAVVTATPRVETFADGRLAYLASKTIVNGPQHAASHVTMALESFAALPGAPQVSASANGRRVNLVWTRADGAVNGYRVEYRLEDGAWNELEAWFDRDTRTATFNLGEAGQRAAFRVRAWSDGGTGPYSQAVPVNAPRRRAVR